MRSSILTATLTFGTALATPMVALGLHRRDNGTALPEVPTGCVHNTGAGRQCYVAGDRRLSCIDWNQICPVGWGSPFAVVDEADNRAECASKAEGDTCTTVWTCCPPS